MAPRELPDGWHRFRFGDIAESITERVDDPSSSGLDHYVGLEHLDPDTIRISRWGSPSDVEATKLRFYPGDVIYARRRAYQRKLGVAAWDGIASAHALVLRARPEVCLPEFLPYFLQSDQFHQRALDISVGSLSPTINWKTLAVQEFALPLVRAQGEIVEVLAAATENVEAHQSVFVASADLREALLEELSEREQSFLPLADLAHVVSGESWSADAEVPAPTQGAVAVIGISALKPDGHVDESSETFVSGLSSKRSLFLTDDKTLLVIRTNGNADRIGNVYRAGGGIEGRALSAFIFGCRFNNAEQRDLAFEYMRGRRFQKWATSLVAGSTGLKNLPIRELRKIPIPVATSPDVLSQLQRLRAVRNLEEATERVIQTSRQSIAALRENLLGGVHVQ